MELVKLENNYILSLVRLAIKDLKLKLINSEKFWLTAGNPLLKKCL